MEKSFHRSIDSLHDIFDFLENFISGHNLSESLAFKIRFAVEEIFTNMVKYNSPNPHDISIVLDVDITNAIVRLIDYEAIPFDITRKEFEAGVPLEERKPGGLGIHLVKNMVETIDYEHVGNMSTITLTMRLE